MGDILKKLVNSTLLILIFIFTLINITACSIDSQYSTELFAMDTVMSINAYGAISESAVKLAEDKINELDSVLSIGKDNSEISTLNKTKSVHPSADTANLISRACEISELTNGDFDITVHPLVYEWGFYSGLENRVPTQNEIDNALGKVDYKQINISDNNITLQNEMSVDVGGITKGYASALIADIFRDNDVESAMVSLGGNVRVIGGKPDGSSWVVSIADPDDTTKQIGTLSVKNTSVITSGGYQRYFDYNGKRYHHIIDTKTGYPAQSGLKSVTIVSEDDTLADALSTALFVKGLDESIDFYKENNELFEAVFVTEENEIYITPDLKECFVSDKKFEVIEI